MKFKVSTAVANFVRRADPEVEFRLEAQAEALDESVCIDARVGQWIDAHDVEYLNAVLDLDDFDFAKRFPSVNHVTYDRRQRMKAEIQTHLAHCPHCSLKHGFELELDSRIMRACRENRDDLLQLLNEEDREVDEGEHRTFETWTNNSEHQPEIHCEPEIIIDPLVEPA